MVRKIIISLALLVVAGCQSSAPIGNVPVQDRDGDARNNTRPSAPVPGENIPVPRQAGPDQPNAAVVALLGKAQRQEKTLDYAAATASLERAIRITPRDANLYFRLAGVRLKQDSIAQAEQLCRKAVALADDSRYMELKCEALLQSL